jgi:hypothetical protein
MVSGFCLAAFHGCFTSIKWPFLSRIALPSAEVRNARKALVKGVGWAPVTTEKVLKSGYLPEAKFAWLGRILSIGKGVSSRFSEIS